MFPYDFDNIDRIEGAAWVNLASVLLNLDEFITSTTVLQTERAAKRTMWKVAQDMTRDGDAERGDGGWIMPCVTNRHRRAGGTSLEFWVRVV